jgi:hypothetical protein
MKQLGIDKPHIYKIRFLHGGGTGWKVLYIRKPGSFYPYIPCFDTFQKQWIMQKH